MVLDIESHTHSHPDNPVVFFDVSIGGIDAGRIKMELFKDLTPKTAENFRCAATAAPPLHFLAPSAPKSDAVLGVSHRRQLCTGEFRKGLQPQGYKDCRFHRIIKGFMARTRPMLLLTHTESGTDSCPACRFKAEIS